MRIPSGVTDQYLYFVAMYGGARVTGLSSFTVYRSRDGAAAAAYTTPTVNETDATNMPGVYELLLDEDMTIGAGNDSEEVCIHISKTGMDSVTRTFELYRREVTAGETLTVSSGAVSTVTTVTGAVGSVTGAVGSVTGNVGGNVVGSVASVTAGVTLTASAVQAIWDALTSALTTVGSIGKLLVDNINATISSRLASAGYTAPLDAAGTRSAVGLASANLDTQIGDLPTNAELATALGTADDAVLAQVALVKAKTDSLTFTVAGQVDANIQYVNDTVVTGAGTVGSPWGP